MRGWEVSVCFHPAQGGNFRIVSIAPQPFHPPPPRVVGLLWADIAWASASGEQPLLRIVLTSPSPVTDKITLAIRGAVENTGNRSREFTLSLSESRVSGRACTHSVAAHSCPRQCRHLCAPFLLMSCLRFRRIAALRSPIRRLRGRSQENIPATRLKHQRGRAPHTSKASSLCNAQLGLALCSKVEEPSYLPFQVRNELCVSRDKPA